jgi:hypothetical protein
MLRKVFKKHKMSITKNRKRFLKNKNHGGAEVLKPLHVDNAAMPAIKIKEKRFPPPDQKKMDSELVQRSRIALLGLKRSLACGVIVFVIMTIVYFMLR